MIGATPCLASISTPCPIEPDKHSHKGQIHFHFWVLLVSADGMSHTYYEHDGATWKPYQDLPDKVTRYDRQHWEVKASRLSDWVLSYDWIGADGYNNFGNWVENAK